MDIWCWSNNDYWSLYNSSEASISSHEKYFVITPTSSFPRCIQDPSLAFMTIAVASSSMSKFLEYIPCYLRTHFKFNFGVDLTREVFPYSVLCRDEFNIVLLFFKRDRLVNNNNLSLLENPSQFFGGPVWISCSLIMENK